MKTSTDFLIPTSFARTVAASVLLSALAACAPGNPMKTAPPEIIDVTAQAAKIPPMEYKPEVDILFVIDNSDSMAIHQENLKKNIDRFVTALEKNERLDFHIGAVSIFDSKRFGPLPKPVQNFFPLGQLRPLKDPQHPGEAVPGASFVTRAPRYSEILGETLKIGTQARGTAQHDLGGPEFEESFSPVVAALDGRNAGFLRAEAHLAVIMITDANDESDMTASQLDQFLWNLKGQNHDNVSTFGVLALKNCPQDPGGPPTKILDFLRISQGKSYNLCDENFGDRLGEVGKIIQQRASRLKIKLNAVPDITTLSVKFGGVDVLQDPIKGWSLDPDLNSIIISGDAELKGDASARLDIQYKPVDPRRMLNGKAKSASPITTAP